MPVFIAFLAFFFFFSFLLQDGLIETLRRTRVRFVCCFLPQHNAGLLDLNSSTPINDESLNATISGEPNIASILSDFEVAITPTNQYRPDITYIPPGEFRMIDMYSAYNLNKVDVSVYWKDVYGNLNPVFLGPGCSGHVKLMFRRKAFLYGVK